MHGTIFELVFTGKNTNFLLKNKNTILSGFCLVFNVLFLDFLFNNIGQFKKKIIHNLLIYSNWRVCIN